VAVSEGIITRSSRERREPIKLIVCAPPAPHQFSRTSRPSVVMMIWGRRSHAAAVSVIRRTGFNRSVTAAMSVGSSVAGSRLRGHQPPSGTPSAVDERGNTSRGSCCVEVMRRNSLCGERSRTDIMSALPPPVSNRLPALTTTPTWTSALDVPPVTAPYSHLSASSAGDRPQRVRAPRQSDHLAARASRPAHILVTASMAGLATYGPAAPTPRRSMPWLQVRMAVGVADRDVADDVLRRPGRPEGSPWTRSCGSWSRPASTPCGCRSAVGSRTGWR
jgi:hypothetical protein